MTAPDGKEVPAQMSDGKVIFLASVPSVGYAVYDVRPSAGPIATESHLKVSEQSLENEYYRVQINEAGDVASIFDKKLNRELLSAPARLAISYDNPGAMARMEHGLGTGAGGAKGIRERSRKDSCC